MKEYSLKDIIVGLRGEYQLLQTKLEVMKQSLIMDNKPMEPDQIHAWIADKNHIEFYVPAKKKHMLKLLGKFSKTDSQGKNNVSASEFENDQLKVLNSDYGIIINPDYEEAFYQAAMNVLDHNLVVDPPYRCTYLTPAFKSVLHVRANGITASESYGRCFDYVVDYDAANDQIVLNTDYEEVHSMILQNALEKRTPASVFSPYFQDKIEKFQDKELDIPIDAGFYYESKYGFLENNDKYTLKRVSGKARF